MIQPDVECFYLLHARGEAAEQVASAFSPASMADISDAILISRDFDTDIEAINELDDLVELMKLRVDDGNLVELETLNPLYFPASTKDIDSVLDDQAGPEGDDFSFVGLDGSPFTVKFVNISRSEQDLITGKVAYKRFDLPSYNEIILDSATLN